jgi:alkylation response protein AidB-like acyl-CoA dehydrogenase
VSIRPIKQINGEVHLCQVFFENVRVPLGNLIGEAGKGWSYAKFLLDHERTASAFIYWSLRELAKVKCIARAEIRNGRPLLHDPAFRSQLIRVEAQLRALYWSVLRMLAQEQSPYNLTARASVLKVRGSSLQQAVTELQLQALGIKALRQMPRAEIYAHPGDDELWPDYSLGRANVGLIMRAASIYGGAKQIQKNILAKLAFGL